MIGLRLRTLLLALLALPPLAAARVRLPHVHIDRMTLPNGLCALLVERHEAPVVNVEVWYHVGSKDEKAGQTGFAHLFEHLMFDGTTNLGPDEFSNYIVKSGGMDNAYTTEDATVFWETVPSADLPVALWLEADRMRNLSISERSFKNEREVVKEERRQRFDNQPYGNVVEVLYQHAFTVHPYHHVPIGSMEDLDRASLAEVRSFHDTYYVPNNATVVMVGDFTSAAAQAMVLQYFAAIPRGAPLRRDIPAEPPQKAPRTVKLTQNVALPAVIEGFHMPADGTPDAYPLRLASKILSEGESSRIYRRLVYEKQMALDAESEGNFTEDPNLFFVFAVLNNGYTPAQAEAEMESVLDDLRRHPVPDAELDKAKNEILGEFIVDRQGVQARADELGSDAVILKDPDLVNSELERFLAVTPADIERVARQYFVPDNMTRLEVYPDGKSRQGSGQ
ncbi:MAG TPA: pitrilysin family protein [Terriglobia bacterium]|nr:pitrilysin family protein [Terriglobia bacterium]